MPSQLVNLLRRLAWTDYWGPVAPGSTYAAETWMNFTVTRPRFEPGPSGFTLADEVTITVIFDPHRSWVLPAINTSSAQQQQFLLDHEQAHYDICALCARDCFIKLMWLKTRTWPTSADGAKDFNWYFNLYHCRWEKTDHEYDIETGHSQANVFVPSTSLFTPPPQKGQPQRQWEHLIDLAFHTVRPTGEIAPGGKPYKMELGDVLRNAGIRVDDRECL
jgi:hypothetical protein